MTEDETFRKLAQRPYDEVRQKIRELYRRSPAEFSTEDYIKILKDSGWTSKEWPGAGLATGKFDKLKLNC